MIVEIAGGGLWLMDNLHSVSGCIGTSRVNMGQQKADMSLAWPLAAGICYDHRSRTVCRQLRIWQE